MQVLFKYFQVSFFLMTLFFASSALPKTFELDNQASRIEFKVGHLVFSSQTGVFKEFSGTADFDLKENFVRNLKTSIAVKTIDTDNPERDEHLRSEDFFHEQKYPVISFIGESFKYSEQGSLIEISGPITMRGVSKNIVFQVNDWTVDDSKIEFEAQTKLRRKDFGIDYGVNMAVGNEVKITIHAVAKKK